MMTQASVTVTNVTQDTLNTAGIDSYYFFLCSLLETSSSSHGNKYLQLVLAQF